MPTPSKSFSPPCCPKKPRSFREFDLQREDPYFWLREKENPEVRAYVESENQYFDSVMAPLKSLENQLYAELKQLIEPVAIEVPYVSGPYEYGSRIPEGEQYPIHFRKPAGGGPEEILLDLNAMAKGLDYLALHDFHPSPAHDVLAYSIDTDGSEHDTIHFRNLKTGALISGWISGASGSTAWSADGKYLFYTKLNQNDRPYRVYRHELGQDPGADALIYEETDPRFFLGVSNSKDGEWIVIEASSKESSETQILPADAPLGEPRIFEPRQEFHTYSVEPQGGRFLVLSNLGERNFKLFETPLGATSRENWREVLSGNERIDLRELEVFRDAYVVLYGDEGTQKVSVYSSTNQKRFDLEFDEEIYSASLFNNHEYDLDRVRVAYSSPRRPMETLEYDLSTGQKTLLHRRNVPGFDPSLYETKKIYGRGEGGVRVPISVFYRKDRAKLPAPTLVMGYGAYGIPYPFGFRSQAVNLADRGFVYAIAHVRGGGCLGQRWYDEGKFLKKKNSFTDLVACSEALIEQGFAKKGELSIYGGSAGGLLVTAAMNLRPDLFKVVCAIVPFVDVLNTMLDDSLPLTPIEYDEWGNPKDETYYRYLRSYSPYDNLEQREYPHLFMTCGWNDPRVTYWEPAKFAARMRELRTDSRLTLLKTNMGAGHAGQSGRFEVLKEFAEMNAFLYAAHFEPELLKG